MNLRAVTCLVFSCLWAVVGPVGPSGAQAADKPLFGPQVRTLIQTAAREGRLDLSWSASGFGDNGKDIGAWVDAFNRFYGLHLTYTFTPAPSMGQQATNVVQAAQSNAAAPTDIVILGSDNLLPVLDARASRPYPWQALTKEAGVTLPAAAVAPGNAAVAFATAVFGIAYNSKTVAANDAPRTLAEVLSPKWKGRVGSTLDAAGFNYLAAFDPHWGPAKTESYMKSLSQQLAGLTRCNDTASLLDGQFDLTVLWCDVSTILLEQERGVPLGFTVPRDGPIINFWYMALPKTGNDPAAAALFVLFMLTKQGQDLSWQADRHDLALLPGSRTAALLPANAARVAGGRGVQAFIGHRETLEYTADYMKLLRNTAPK